MAVIPLIQPIHLVLNVHPQTQSVQETVQHVKVLKPMIAGLVMKTSSLTDMHQTHALHVLLAIIPRSIINQTSVLVWLDTTGTYLQTLAADVTTHAHHAMIQQILDVLHAPATTLFNQEQDYVAAVAHQVMMEPMVNALHQQPHHGHTTLIVLPTNSRQVQVITKLTSMEDTVKVILSSMTHIQLQDVVYGLMDTWIISKSIISNLLQLSL